MPHLVEPLLPAPRPQRLAPPTPDFRRAVVESRGRSAWGFLAKTTDPERALRNLLERDRTFTDILRDETARLELPAVEVDAATTDHFVFEGFTTELDEAAGRHVAW